MYLTFAPQQVLNAPQLNPVRDAVARTRSETASNSFARSGSWAQNATSAASRRGRSVSAGVRFASMATTV